MLPTNCGLINMYMYIGILFVHMCCLKTHEPYIGICSKYIISVTLNMFSITFDTFISRQGR